MNHYYPPADRISATFPQTRFSEIHDSRVITEQTLFFHGQHLNLSETSTLEFKKYKFPFSDQLKEKLKQTICAFLNKEGGMILIGITDDSFVNGVWLKSDEKSATKTDVLNLLYTFEPPIRTEGLVSISFIPVYGNGDFALSVSRKENFVVKIVVNAGHPDVLYSIDDQIPRCYLRSDGHNMNLKTKEIFNEVKKRAILPKRPIEKQEIKAQSVQKASESEQNQSDRQTDVIVYYVFPKQGDDDADQKHFSEVVRQLRLEQCGIKQEELIGLSSRYPETRKGKIIFCQKDDASSFIKYVKEKLKYKNKLYYAYSPPS